MLPFQTLTIENLRGVQTKKSITQKLLNEAESCAGGYFDTVGAFNKRKGGEKFNTTSLGGRIVGGYDFRYYVSGTLNQKIIACAGTTINTVTSSAITAIKTGMTSNIFYDFAQHVPFQTDYSFITNGTDTMLKYDGTTVTNAGITRPASAPSAAVAAGGSLAVGAYRIRVTYVRDPSGDEGQESNPSDEVTATTSGANLTINLTSIPVSTDPQVTKRFIYISEVGGAILYKHGEINDNTTTTYSITSLGTLGVEIQFDHDTPPAVKFIEAYKSRLVGARTAEQMNRFFWSKALDVWYWPQGDLDQEVIQYFDVGNKPITGIKSFFDSVLIFQEDEMWRFAVGEDGLNPVFERIRTDELIGCVANRTIVIQDNYCYFLGRNGYYRTDGISVESVSEPISDYFTLYSNNSTYQINKNAFEDCCAVVEKEKNLILLFAPTGSNTENNMCYAMGIDGIVRDQGSGTLSPNWCPWPGFTTSYAFSVIDNGRARWFRGDTNGYIYRQDALDGDGSNITSYATSAGASTLTDSTQSWTANLYAGLNIYIISGYGAGQSRVISSNTGTEVTTSSAWSTVPNTTSRYAIGGIPYHYKHAWNNYGQPSLYKRWRWVRPRFNTTGSYLITAYYGYDYIEVDTDELSTRLSTSSLWDVGMWDDSYWDGIGITQDKQGVTGSRNHIASTFKIENNAAGENIIYNGCDKIYQMKGVR